MKKLLLGLVAGALLLFPAAASAAVSPHYSYDQTGNLVLACVVVTLDSVDIGDKPVTVRFKSPSGSGGGIVRNWNPGDYPMTFCVSGATYTEGGGYGWKAVASAGGVALGSTVF